MKKAVLLMFLCMPLVASAQLVINELLAKNVSWNMDEGFNFSNWVELYNTSPAIGYNQTNYTFTDDLSNPTKWKPVSKVLTPKSFSIVYFERDEIAGHATFKMKPEGGVLYLINVGGVVVDSVSYPAQYRNISWGRKTDASALWGFSDVPTPGSTNAGGSFAS
jgi:hypothetical protein